MLKLLSKLCTTRGSPSNQPISSTGANTRNSGWIAAAAAAAAVCTLLDLYGSHPLARAAIKVEQLHAHMQGIER
jgi:hypothetical protein